jgi:hypothetical protein
MTQIATEAFFIHPGLFKALFWDVEVQRENQTTWEPILKWKLVEADARPRGKHVGNESDHGGQSTCDRSQQRRHENLRREG